MDSTLRTLQNAISAMENTPEEYRPRTADGRPGGLIDLSLCEKDIYILGDLHGIIKNLTSALETDDLEEKLASDEAVLLLLGDLVHDDRVGHLTEMEPSLQLLEHLFELINKYPNNIFTLRGNHDTFDRNVAKSGIRQAELFHRYIEEQRTIEYAEYVETFFELLPLVALADQFIAIHAGPIRGGASREHLVEVYRYDADMFQLMWNRINQIGSVPNNKEYGPEDISITKEILGYSEDSYLIVGHNPLLDRGGGESVWFDVMGVKNYIITYNGLPEVCPILVFRNGAPDHELLFADLKIHKPRFVLGDY